jgi:PAS domain S-box-containing protein
MKINFSVRTFLVFLAVTFTTIPVVLFGIYEVRSGVERANQQASETNREAALLIERDIASAIDRYKTVFESLGAGLDMKTLRFPDEDRVVGIIKQYPQITAFSVLDKDATSVWVYSPSGTTQTGIDYSNNEVNSRSRATRQPAISGTDRSRVTGVPSILFSIPLLDKNGELSAFIGGSIPIEQFRAKYELAPEQFYVVLDSFGRLVSSSNPPALDAWTEFLADASSGDIRVRTDKLNARVNLMQVAPIGWKVAVGFPNSYLMTRAREAFNTALVVGLVCALLGAVIAGGTAFVLTRGLDNVGQQVEAMSAADLRPITLSQHGIYPREVFRLVGNFNNLLDRAVRTHHAEFEAISKVADTILIARSDGQITYVNETGTRLFGNVVGKPFESIVGRDIAATIFAGYPTRDWKGEISLTTADGMAFDGFLSSTSVLENNKLTSVVAIIQDITQQKAARETVVQSEKMITLGELVAGTSHELNNPLAIISGYADLLLEEPSLHSEQRIKIDSIRRNARRASSVVHSLLAFARKRKPERTKTDVNAVLEAAAELKEYDLRTSGIPIEKHLTPNLPFVYADPNQLQQVLLNIINNAQDAVGKSSTPKITMRTGTADGKVFIKIADTGAGIAKADLKKVFDPFFTTKPVGKGTGLGLSISYGIIREHGGEIRVQSQLGHGTEVCIELPVDRTAPVSAPASPSLSHAFSGSRFLVVDDEPDVTTILRTGLSRKGHLVDTAGNIGDALRLAEKNQYDFIITDIKMPGGSGIDLYKKLRLSNSASARRMIFLTGDTSNPSTIQFLENEGLTYFSKPFDLDVLHEFLIKARTHPMLG